MTGSTIYTFFASGAVVNSVWASTGGVGVGLAQGLALGALIYSLRGAHINPAVTWGAVWSKRIQVFGAIMFVIAQLLGAVLAGFLLKSCVPFGVQGLLGATVLGPGVGVAQGVMMEGIATTFIVFIYFSVAVENRDQNNSISTILSWGPLAVGLTQTAATITAFPISGASFNPARSLGSAVAASVRHASTTWVNHWIYWVGPLIGASVGTLLHELIFLIRDRKPFVPLPT